ncbi:hypothetical protein IFM89_011627 [Coptis chinensis]|uniref:Leucine-rich repeat-containing N-terminal plant-type domain-containing protein n=1 Tax=Coptis chinensis TaxID=261450 RepID=A0A835IVL8_9MAGN|nr:hypothetical protein IFM89_011627 [Coptis chinensis]
MVKRILVSWTIGLLFMAWIEGTYATLSPSGINYEVVALMAIKNGLKDPYNVLENWDSYSVDPCSWRMVTCTPDGHVSALLLQNNDIHGPIPVDIGKLEKLQTLDLSNNSLSGEIPSSLGNLKNLNYLRLNNNSLSGPCPDSLSNIEGLTLVIVGNPLICGQNSANNCSAMSPEPLSFPPDVLRDQSQPGSARTHRMVIAFASSVGSVSFVIIVVGFLLWWRYRHNQQIFFDVNGWCFLVPFDIFHLTPFILSEDVNGKDVITYLGHIKTV